MPGIDLVPFTWDRDDEVRRAHNAAFTRHHGSSERDPEAWQCAVHRAARLPPRPVRASPLEDGAVVGYVLAYVYEADTAARGTREVVLGQIGVLPPARGRGVAGALIAEVLRGGGAAATARAQASASTPRT